MSRIIRAQSPDCLLRIEGATEQEAQTILAAKGYSIAPTSNAGEEPMAMPAINFSKEELTDNDGEEETPLTLPVT